MRFKIMCLTVIMGCCILSGCNNQNSKQIQDVQTDNDAYVNDNDGMEYTYEIQKVFHDNEFNNIIVGKSVPVEIVYGIGGENGYTQYSTKNPEIINEYMKAFREVKIKQVIANQEEMIVIFDGIEDYGFIMEDGTEIVLGTDCSKYVIDGDIEYVLENNEKLFELNERIKGN